ncbi:MAG: BamA/TamA family outer membrane protein [Chitinophagales bacterium]
MLFNKLLLCCCVILLSYSANLMANFNSSYSFPPLPSSVQKDTTKNPLIQKSSFVALPLAFYTPETRLGGGAALLYVFRFRGQDPESRPSQVQLGFAYTQEKQSLNYLPFQLFLKEGKYNVYGELGYYRYFFYFYGIGNDLPDEREIYSVTFPRVRLNVLQQVYPNLYAGFRYYFDNYNITERTAGGLLEQDNILGSNGGRISSLGLVATYDSRNHLFFPTEGWLVEFSALRNGEFLGSDFNFSRLSLDAATYRTNKWDHVIALNAWFNFNFGDVPFNEMAVIGGTKKMRGYFEGRYRDKKVWMLQGEYRWPELIGKRFGIVGFAGLGSVATDFKDFSKNKIHYSYGAGMRFMLSKKEKVNVRIDVGVDEVGDILPYVTVTEAF